MTIEAASRRDERWIKGQERMIWEGQVKAISATQTLGPQSPMFNSFDPDGADQKVIMPAESTTDRVFKINNIGAADDLTIRNSLDTITVLTMTPGQNRFFGSNGTAWLEVL